MSRAEAKSMAANNPCSFLRVSRAEIGLPHTVGAYDEAVYQQAAANLRYFEHAGYLVREKSPSFYIYRISNETHSQTGIAFAASVEAYNANRIRKHELTRPTKEDDRVRQIEATNAETAPVLLAHKDDSSLAAAISDNTEGSPDLTSHVDGWQHDIWIVSDSARVNQLSNQLNAFDAFYIADGHHRSAAAARVCAARDNEQSLPHHGFLAVSFAASEMRILDYNRVVRDLRDYTADAFLGVLDKDFDVEISGAAVAPKNRGEFGMFLGDSWYTLRLKRTSASGDPVEQLDVRLLYRYLLSPLLDIKDPRTDERIDFIGGSRGTAAVEARVTSGDMAVGFTLCPTPMADLMAVADANRIMPPKSTWFEPKLADGLISLPLD